MSNYYHTIVKRREIQSSPDQAKRTAEVVFQAADSNIGTTSVLDALDALGIAKADVGKLTEFGDIERLDSLAFGLNAEHPDWTDGSVKVWLIGPAD